MSEVPRGATHSDGEVSLRPGLDISSGANGALHCGMSALPPAPRRALSATLGWLCTGALLLVGVPLFLRMPLWCDATLYAVAARTVSSGGVHYRDVFDTNPPGFVWLVAAVRGAFGDGDFALRVADLVVMAVVVPLLLRWARVGGASRAAVAWAAAAFYPYSQEFDHVQRDTWMMLPALAAVALRMRRAERGPAPLLAVGEGLGWGAGSSRNYYSSRAVRGS